MGGPPIYKHSVEEVTISYCTVLPPERPPPVNDHVSFHKFYTLIFLYLVYTFFHNFRANLPFQQCHHLLNPWNENKRVQISRDGQVNNLSYLHLTFGAWAFSWFCLLIFLLMFVLQFGDNVCCGLS